MQPETKTPVMDIAPPPKTEHAKNDIAIEKNAGADAKIEAAKDSDAKNNDKVTKSKATVEKKSSSAAGVVFLTILVMFALAGLAIFAYMSSNK